MLQLLRSKTHILRSCRITTSVLNKQNVHKVDHKSNDSDYIPVYKFPLIRTFGLINRIKLYQTVLTLGGIPISLALSTTNIIDIEAVYVTASLGLTGCIVLYSVGLLTDKFIGFVYINKNEENVKVSYLNFWGSRKDVIIPLNDIVPFSDMPVSVTDSFYLKFSRFSVKDRLKINLRYGQLLNKEGFNKIFVRDI